MNMLINRHLTCTPSSPSSPQPTAYSPETMKQQHLLFSILCLFIANLEGGHTTAQASEPATKTQIPNQSLMAFTQDFVKRIRTGYTKADAYYETYFANDLRAQDSFLGIPDGEVLLLQISLSRTLKLRNNIVAIKQGRDVMLSLSEFAAIAQFPIDVDAQNRTAQGWFIRESNPFSLDLNNNIVTAGAENHTILNGDILEQDDDIYVRGSALAQWMKFEMEVSLQQQNLAVKTSEKWPVQAALDRANRKISPKRLPPSLPRKHSPYKMIDVPNADLNIRHQYSRNGDTGNATKRTSYSLRTSGDLASHTSNIAISGTDEEALSSLRATFSRESDKPELLGPLGARLYEFGDIRSTGVPLAGPAKNGLGVRVTNENPNFTSNATTSIFGEGIAGWDSEIYRGTRLLGSTQIGEDGRYIFDNIALFPGSNIFRIISYGPFGEVREEEEVIFAGTDLFSDKGIYDVSLTAADTQFYTNSDNDSDEKGEPQLSASYETQLGQNSTVRAGLRASSTDGERKEYIQSGITTNLNQNLVNLDAAYDIDGATQLAASVRRRLGSHAASLTGTYSGEGFGDTKDAPSPSSYSLNSTISGSLGRLYGKAINYNFDNKYNAIDGGSTSFETALGLSARIDRLTVSQNLSHSINKDAGGDKDTRTDGNTNIRGSLWRNNWRAGARYNISPVFEPVEYSLDISRRLKRNLRGTLDVEHKPLSDETEGRASLSFTGQHLTLSPSVTYDDDKNLGAFVNLRTALAYDPHSEKAVFTGRSIERNGGVSAFVYLDKDGDLKFSEDDEPLRDVEVRALHANRSAETNENGVAFIYNLPSGRVTDTFVEENTLPDAFFIAGTEGVSVAPRAGQVTQVDFPIHISGEIDGTIYKQELGGNKTALSNIRLNLHRISDGSLIKTASSGIDGFYLFDRVPPDAYYILLNPADLAKRQAAAPPPKAIEIGYEGTVVSSNNIILQAGSNVAFDIPRDYNHYINAHPDIDFSALKDQRFVLNLGQYNSNILMSLTWFKVRAMTGGTLKQARLMVEPSQSKTSKKSNLHVLRVLSSAQNLEQSHQQCAKIASTNTPCVVEILPEKFEIAHASN
jgi:hypothetical protein